MAQIVVTPEQARILANTTGSVEIVDSQGRRLGFFARPFSVQDLAEARQRAQSHEPRLETSRVLERLRSLEQG